MKPLDGKPVRLSNATLFKIASYLKMPGEEHDKMSLQNFRLVSKRFNHVVVSQRHLLQHQLIGDLAINIVGIHNSLCLIDCSL